MNRFILIPTAILALFLASCGQTAEISVTSAASSVSEAENIVPESESLSEPQSSETDSSAENLENLGTMGEPYTLHGYTPKQGVDPDNNFPSFGWNGDMILTVTSARVEDYDLSGYDDASIEILSRYASNCDDPCMIVVDIALENVDAKQDAGVQYEFYMGVFQLSSARDFIPKNQARVNYVSTGSSYGGGGTFPVFNEHGSEDRYEFFTLTAGNSMQTTLTYVVDREYLNEDTSILAASIARAKYCGVILDKLEM